MNREDAFYYENLLVLGFSDEYDRWLNSFLEKEDPLYDIIWNKTTVISFAAEKTASPLPGDSLACFQASSPCFGAPLRGLCCFIRSNML